MITTQNVIFRKDEFLCIVTQTMDRGTFSTEKVESKIPKEELIKELRENLNEPLYKEACSDGGFFALYGDEFLAYIKGAKEFVEL